MSMDAVIKQEHSNLDVVDRFFIFTEAFICGEDNGTANIQLDPTVLAKEEERPMFACGPRTLEREPSMIEVTFCETELCGSLQDRGSDEQKGGLETGSVLTHFSKESTNRRRRFWSFFRCNGRDKAEDVVH